MAAETAGTGDDSERNSCGIAKSHASKFGRDYVFWKTMFIS